MKKIGFLILFCALIGLVFGGEYGVSWDEAMTRNVGAINVKYILFNDHSFHEFPDRDYGVAFELPLIFSEVVLGARDPHYIYLLRHLLTHFFFLIGAGAAAVLIRHLYRKNWLAYSVFLMLLLHPRLYAHSFFNSKDLPFLSLMLCAFLAFYRTTIVQNTRNYVLLGIISGLLINIRLLGIMIPLYALGHLFLLIATQKNERLQYAKYFGILLFCTLLTLYASWPYLWESPYYNFIAAFQQMSNFIRWKGHVLFFGNLISGKALPFYYAPAWFLMTTPIIILLLGFLGLGIHILNFLKNISLHFVYFTNPNTLKNTNFIAKIRLFLYDIYNAISAFAQSPEAMNTGLHICVFLLPFVGVIKAHSVLYDDWRHLYFTYAGFVLLAARGFLFLQQKSKKLAIFAAACMLPVVFFMLQNYSFAMVYFNEFVPKTPNYLSKNFDYDYWGASYKQGLNYILAHDTAAKIIVLGNDSPAYYNADYLLPTMRNRVKIVDSLFSADYFITTNRLHCPQYKGSLDSIAPYKYHSFVVQNSSVMDIYKFKK